MTMPGLSFYPTAHDVLRLTGRDRQGFLQGMVTNDVVGLAPGRGCYAFHLTSKGQILADLLIVCREDELVLLTEPGWGESLAASLEHHLVMERVKIAPVRLEAGLVVVGSGAAPLLESWGAAGGGEWGEGDSAPLENATLVVRTARGYLLCSPDGAWESRLHDAGATALTTEQAENGRLELGIPRGRIDFDEKTLALETGQAARAIHYRKGCYVGQEVVARLDARGHTNRGLVQFEFAAAVSPGARLLYNGNDVGWLTSCGLSPSTGHAIALGYLRHEQSRPGTEVEADGIAGQVIRRLVGERG